MRAFGDDRRNGARISISMATINPVTFRRLWRLVKPFLFSSEVKWQARGLLLLLAFFALSIAGINVGLSYIARDFMTAFSLKEEDEFFRMLGFYLAAFAAATPVTVFYSYTEQRLALLYRSWLSREILKKYFSDLAFYRIGAYEGIDNPDQRIEEDIRSFTQTSLSFFLIMCNALLTLVLFVNILWSISFNLIMAVVAYAFLGSVITYLIGKPLIALNFEQLKKEADYRYKLVNVRDHAESIAFYRGSKKELTRARQRLKKALDNIKKIINLNRNLGFFITFYNNLKPVLPIVIVSPLYLSGKIQFGEVTQSADAFVRVVEALSILIQHFATISAITAVVTRLGSFTEALDEAGRGAREQGSLIKIEEGDKIAFDHVTIITPKRDQLLVRDLTWELTSGGMLITGGSGNGKSSILRVLAGLWNAGEGKIIRPRLERTVFLPQRPYLVLGSLRNQLVYALPHQALADRELEGVLERVGLMTMLERVKGLGAVCDWGSILSAGEQQQLAFARLLLAKPEYVFLDEATTAVDIKTEAALYAAVQASVKAFISVGYRGSIAQYHHVILELEDDMTWRLLPSEQS